MVAKLDGLKREETEKDAQYREHSAKKLTPCSSPAGSSLASALRSPSVSVGEDDDLRFSGDTGGHVSGMELDRGLEGGLTPPPPAEGFSIAQH